MERTAPLDGFTSSRRACDSEVPGHKNDLLVTCWCTRYKFNQVLNYTQESRYPIAHSANTQPSRETARYHWE